MRGTKRTNIQSDMSDSNVTLHHIENHCLHSGNYPLTVTPFSHQPNPCFSLYLFLVIQNTFISFFKIHTLKEKDMHLLNMFTFYSAHILDRFY